MQQSDTHLVPPTLCCRTRHLVLWRQWVAYWTLPTLPPCAAPNGICSIDTSQKAPGASVWKRLAGCFKRLGQRIHGSSLLYPICRISAANGEDSIQAQTWVSVRTLGLLDHLIGRI